MSRSSAPQVLERPRTEPARPATPVVPRAAAPADAAAPGDAAPAVADVPQPEPAPGRSRRRLPQPPGRRAPLWLAALVLGSLLAAVPGLTATPEGPTASGSDYGLGAGDLTISGGIIDVDARRSVSEAEAQQRLGELAASRAAREPATVVPLADYRLTTCFCNRWGQMHPAWDMAAPLGTPIYSATDGVVIRAGRASGFGYAVYIQDADGNVHIYGHMRYYDVEAGQVVRAGDQIARVGNEGFSTGPHVHWQIQRGGLNGRPTDPQDWLAERGIST